MSFTPLEKDVDTAFEQVDIITLPSDDGFKQKINILNCNQYIGIQTWEEDRANKEEASGNVPVWLGDSTGDTKEARLLKEIWECASDTFEYYNRDSGYKGFNRQTKKYNRPDYS